MAATGYGTLTDKVYTAIAESIVTGELPPGMRLMEVELAERYGMSRGPLREAIRRLEEKGLVERSSQRRVHVVHLTPERLQAVYDVREVLEGMACRLAAERITKSELIELERLLISHEKIVRENNAYLQRQQDLDFHSRIVKASRNPCIESLLLDELYQLIKTYRNQHKATPGRPKRALMEHWRIFHALEDRDPGLAEISMRRHISSALKVISTPKNQMVKEKTIA